VLVVDDYAHHPTEVRATIAAALRAFPERRIIGVHQPHTYSRISYLWDDWLTCWDGLSALVVLETYAAREKPLPGYSAADLSAAIRGVETVYASDFDDAAARLALARPGDVVFTIGGRCRRVGPAAGALSVSAIETLATTLSPFGELRRRTSRGTRRSGRWRPTSSHGPARMLCSRDECRPRAVPVFVLGSGSNILLPMRASGVGARQPCLAKRTMTSSSLRAAPVSRIRLQDADRPRRSHLGSRYPGHHRRRCCLAPAPMAAARRCPAPCAQLLVMATSVVRLTWMVYRGVPTLAGWWKAVLEAEVEFSAGDAGALPGRPRSMKAAGAQPRGRNAGSTFKNPRIRLREAHRRRRDAGMRRGEAAISDKHCNFFVNEGNASAADVAWLIAEAQRRVSEQFGVALEPEVEFVGAW
jgi:hypothetical protein